jgi:hypothetical protein
VSTPDQGSLLTLDDPGPDTLAEPSLTKGQSRTLRRIHLNVLSYGDSKESLVDLLRERVSADDASPVSIADIEAFYQRGLSSHTGTNKVVFPDVNLTLVWGVTRSNLTLDGCPPWMLHSTEIV